MSVDRLIWAYQEVISRKVLVDEGYRQVVQVEQAAIWKFLWLSGTISVNVLVEQNREDHSVRIAFTTFEFTLIASLFLCLCRNNPDYIMSLSFVR